MPQQLARLVWVLGLPTLVVLAAAAVQPRLALLHQAYLALVPYLPYATFALGLMLSWRFNQSRVFFALAVLLVAYWGVDSGLALPRTGVVRRSALNTITLLLPLSLTAIAFLGERGIFTWRGTVRLSALLVLPSAVVFFAATGAGQVLSWLPAELWAQPRFARTPLPAAAVFAFALGSVLLLVRLVWRQAVLDGALLGALVASAAAFHGGARPVSLPVFLTAAGLLLLVGVVQEGYRKAYVDELTGLPGRRALDEELLKLGGQYTVAMLDVDHFKKFNDAHGHQVGDEALRMVASQLSRISGGGRPFRYGGEEFSIIFAGKDVTAARPHLDELRTRIAETPFAVQRRRRGRDYRGKASSARCTQITVSIGLAERDQDHVTPAAVLKAADQALYRAKRSGRNRVRA